MGKWGQGGQLLQWVHGGRGVQLLTVGTWGQGGLAAYSGCMGARGPVAYRAVESWHGPQGYIVLPGPIKLMVPIGMGALDIKYHTGEKYIAFVYRPGPHV